MKSIASLHRFVVFMATSLALAAHPASEAQTFTNKEWVQTAGTPDNLNLVHPLFFPTAAS